MKNPFTIPGMVLKLIAKAITKKSESPASLCSSLGDLNGLAAKPTITQNSRNAKQPARNNPSNPIGVSEMEEFKRYNSSVRAAYHAWRGLSMGAIALIALVIFAGAASAQQPVVTSPSPAGQSVNVSNTITVTNTFQAVIPVPSTTGVNRPRQGCLIQNTGTATQYVFEGPLASATKATSFQLVPPGTGVQGGSYSCATGGGGVVQGPISITGTANDTFTAVYQ